MPTLIGIFFIAFGIFCLVKKEDWLFGFLIFSAIFQASSAINFGAQGIQPYYIVGCLFIYSQAKKKRFWIGEPCFSGKNLLFVFGCLGILSALIFPFIFAGIPVYSPKVGIDDGFFFRPPLHFSLSNIAQAVYLTINLMIVRAACLVPKTDTSRIFYNVSFWVLSGLVLVQFAFLQYGIPFPYSLLQNNPGYSMTGISGIDLAARVMGTFPEPSGAGMALVMFFAGYLYEFFARGGTTFKVIVAAISIGLVRSSSSLVVAFTITSLILIIYPAFQSLLVISKRRFKKLISILAVVAFIALSPMNGALKDYTVEKNQTLSYVNRTAADVFSLQLAADTHWVGVGLGSNRPSSLIASLLSNVGILGTVIFLILVIQVGRNARGKYVWVRWALLGTVFAACLGGPDINQPMIWILLALAAHYGAIPQEERELHSPREAISRISQVS
jgi:hypothetical protein